MSATVVIDSSVAAKWFLPEPDSDRARALLRGEAQLAAPALVRIEVASSIVRAFRMSRIGKAECESYLEVARDFFESGSVFEFRNESLQARAETIAISLPHALKDCLFIALAEQERAKLLTTDHTLIARAARLFPFVRAL